MLPEDTNFYECMRTGVYKTVVARMALIDPSDESEYLLDCRMGRDGKIVPVHDNDVSAMLTIIQMMKIHNKGYPIAISNPGSIREIVEIIYSHISKCIEVRDTHIFGELPVDKNDLIEMESFMIDILKYNHRMVKLTGATKITLDSVYGSAVVEDDHDNDLEETLKRFVRIGSVDTSADYTLELNDLLSI